jgi:hypothetical protein
MPSLNDVYNQLVAVNAALGQIRADDVAETNATTQVKASVDTLDVDLKAGFAATTNALNTLAQIDIQAVKLLFHLTQQADTMICALEHISQNTCAIVAQVTLQTQLQTRLRHDADALHDIAEFAYPGGALESHRLALLRREVEKCCPPEEPEPACTYQPCPAPAPVGMPNLPNVPGQPGSTTK